MATVTIHAAKTNLSKLLERVEAGEEIVIARGRKPVARLVPIGAPDHLMRQRSFGALKGKLGLPDSFFFDPLPEEELQEWEGKER
jgi:prevent-host-death family protein